MRFYLLRNIVVVAVAVFTSAANAENWPGFRGPTRQGLSSEKGLPTKWSPTENVAWKTDIPGAGWSSPIVFGDHVFVTSTIDDTSCRVICLDRRSGKILWNKEVFQQEPKRKEGKNSYATPTPVTDGKLVYAVFGDGSISALAYDGSIVWTNREFKFYSQHGLGASPILYEDLLIMPMDGSSEGPDKSVGWKKPWDEGYLLALDKQSGKMRWQGDRGMSRIAHVTPNVLKHESGDQIVSGAGDVVQGFDPRTGKRIWTIYSQGEGVVPSIVIGDGLIFSASGYEKPTIRAVRTGGSGDVTKTHIAWEQTKGVPSLASFVYVKPHLYAVTEAGVVNCFDAKTGEVVWQERIGGNHSASPVVADGNIYFLSEDGESAIVQAGPEFKLVARNTIGEKCQASMAISQGQLFIRSESRLWCIGNKAAE